MTNMSDLYRFLFTNPISYHCIIYIDRELNCIDCVIYIILGIFIVKDIYIKKDESLCYMLTILRWNKISNNSPSYRQ